MKKIKNFLRNLFMPNGNITRIVVAFLVIIVTIPVIAGIACFNAGRKSTSETVDFNEPSEVQSEIQLATEETETETERSSVTVTIPQPTEKSDVVSTLDKSSETKVEKTTEEATSVATSSVKKPATTTSSNSGRPNPNQSANQQPQQPESAVVETSAVEKSTTEESSSVAPSKESGSGSGSGNEGSGGSGSSGGGSSTSSKVTVQVTKRGEGAFNINGKAVDEVKVKKNGTVQLQSKVTDKNYYFFGWEVNGEIISTSSTYEFKATSNLKVVAVFEKVSFKLAVEKIGEGTVTMNGKEFSSKEFEVDSDVTLKANPADNYEFKCWKINGKNFGTDEVLEITVDKEMKVTAEFVRIQYQLRVAVETPGMGTLSVTDGENGETLLKEIRNYQYVEMNAGSQITVNATSFEGNVLKSWKVDGKEIDAKDDSYTFEATSDADVVAVFVEVPKTKMYTVSVDKTGAGDGTLTIDGQTISSKEFVEGAKASVEATPKEDSVFKEFLVNGRHIAVNPYTFEVTEDRTVIAVFEKAPTKMVTFSVATKGGEGTAKLNGITRNSLTISVGTEVTAEAVANPGYHFVKWEEVPNGSNPYTIVVNESMTLTAVFEEDEPEEEGIEVTYVIDGKVVKTATVKNGETLAPYSSVTIAGRTFTGWMLQEEGNLYAGTATSTEFYFGKESLSSAIARCITEGKNATFVATYEKQELYHTLETVGGEVVRYTNGERKEVNGEFVYQYGTQITVNVSEGFIPEGNQFNYWLMSGIEDPVSYDEEFIFTITKDTVLEAKYSEQNVERLPIVTLTSCELDVENKNVSIYIDCDIPDDYTKVEWGVLFNKTGVSDESFVYEGTDVTIKPDADSSSATANYATTSYSFGVSSIMNANQTMKFRAYARLQKGEDSTVIYSPIKTFTPDDYNIVKETEVSYVIDGKVVKTATVKNGETLEPYAYVTIAGKTFTGWMLQEEGNLYAGTATSTEFYFGEESIPSAIARCITEGKNATFVATYEKQELYHTLETVGGEVVRYTNGERKEVNGEFVYQYGTQITVNVSEGFIPEGNQFNYWLMSGIEEPVSYDEEFIFTITKDTVLEVKYSEEEVERLPIVSLTSCELDVENKNVSIYIDCDIPDDYTKVEWGVLFNKTGVSDESFVYEGTDVTIKPDGDSSSAAANYATTSYSFGVSSIMNANQTMKFRAYARLQKGEDSTVIYSPIKTFTPDDYNIVKETQSENAEATSTEVEETEENSELETEAEVDDEENSDEENSDEENSDEENSDEENSDEENSDDGDSSEKSE